MSADTLRPGESSLRSIVTLATSMPKDRVTDSGSPIEKSVLIPFQCNSAIAIQDVWDPTSDTQGAPLLKFPKGARIKDIVRSSHIARRAAIC